jgi:hypothetical protein
MKDWWPIRSLRLRLTLWYGVTSLIILLALGALLLTLVRYRLSAELDRQLRNDSEFVSTQLEHDDAGGIRLDYESEDKHEPERVGRRLCLHSICAAGHACKLLQLVLRKIQFSRRRIFLQMSDRGCPWDRKDVWSAV